ncbi:carotenoid oxygenase family protein [Anabaena sp. FACHB-1237]|uniref:carotenoid oxygenase family protein n=1 Tax=Anabaena sp. FACHB-1237 TaxID=2692769 RepID=UPI001681046A|nr:carotenoid oxygenase family protein [Anabaena sp. FACHB-1237]MBD2137163.1 carotenoid oxygenase family protein [Anabaena sp. FACHB-1237]
MTNLQPQEKTTKNQALPISYTIEDWQKGYQSQKQEYDYWIDNITGEIPPELHGTLFRNGPGLLDINGEILPHPFDGDGMINKITFINGRAHYRNKFVETEGYLAEKKAGKILYRGVFGTQKPGGLLANIFDLRIKHIANTNVIYWGKKLLALWEAAEPYLLNPYTLETIGNEYFNGSLSQKEAFSAHPRIDTNGTLVNFAIKPGLKTTITIFEINQSGEMKSKKNYQVPGFCFIHDFLITEKYCIFFQNPVNFNPIPFLLGISSASQCIKLQKYQPSKIIIIPRHSTSEDDKMQILETKAGFIFHHVNAFEVANELIVDSICYESLTTVEPKSDYRYTNFDNNSPGQLYRFTINLSQDKVESQLIDKRSVEFPTINPNNVGKPYRFLYTSATHYDIGNAPLQAIFKVDLASGKRQIWSAAPRGFTGEPVFIPRANSSAEDDGWLITVVYNAENNCSDVVILDARDLEKGAVATLHLKNHIPYGLHGSFTPEIFI